MSKSSDGEGERGWGEFELWSMELFDLMESSLLLLLLLPLFSVLSSFFEFPLSFRLFSPSSMKIKFLRLKNIK
jgi:hypothetical protein